MNLLLCVALAVGAPGVKDPPKKDVPPTILGEWTAESITIGGMVLPREKIGGPDTFTFLPDGTVNIRSNAGGANRTETATYKFDDKKSPAEIDLIPPATEKQPTMYGIFKIDGDTLTLCLGEARPTQFETAAGAKEVLVTFKRVPKK